MQGCSRWRMRLSRRSTVVPRIEARGDRRHPKLNFGGASEAVAATEADVQLFWGEPLDGVHERIERLKVLSRELERDLRPLEFGLRITTLVGDTTEQAWADAEAKVAQMATSSGAGWSDHRRAIAVGQQRLLDLHRAGDVLDDNLYTAPRQIRRRRRNDLAGRLGRRRRQVPAQVSGSWRLALRTLRYALPRGDQTPGQPVAAAPTRLAVSDHFIGAIGDPETPKAPWGAFWDHEDVGCGGLMTRRLVFLCPARASHYGTGFPPPVEYTCRRKNLVWVR